MDPHVTVPAARSVPFGVATIIAGLALVDPAVASNPGGMLLNLRCTAGTLACGGKSGGSIQVGGTLAAINTALAALTYTGGAIRADTLVLDAWDQNGTEYGGTLPLTVTAAAPPAPPAPAAPLAAPAVQTAPAEITITPASGHGSFGTALNAAAAEAAGSGRGVIVEPAGDGQGYVSFESHVPVDGLVIRPRTDGRDAVTVQQGNALPIIAMRGGEGGGNDPGPMIERFWFHGFRLVSKGIPNDPTAFDGISRLAYLAYGYQCDVDLTCVGGQVQHLYLEGDWDGAVRCHSVGGGYCIGTAAPGKGTTNPDVAAAELRLGEAIGVPAVQVTSRSTISPGNDTNNNLDLTMWIESSPLDGVGLFMSGRNSVSNRLKGKIEALQSARKRIILLDQDALTFDGLWLAAQGGGTVQDWDWQNIAAGNKAGTPFAGMPGACDTMLLADNCTMDGTIHAELIGGGPQWGSAARFNNCPQRPQVWDVTRGGNASKLRPGGQFVVTG